MVNCENISHIANFNIVAYVVGEQRPAQNKYNCVGYV